MVGFQETQACIYKTDRRVPGRRCALFREADISAGKTVASKEAESAAKDRCLRGKQSGFACVWGNLASAALEGWR